MWIRHTQARDISRIEADTRIKYWTTEGFIFFDRESTWSAALVLLVTKCCRSLFDEGKQFLDASNWCRTWGNVRNDSSRKSDRQLPQGRATTTRYHLNSETPINCFHQHGTSRWLRSRSTRNWRAQGRLGPGGWDGWIEWKPAANVIRTAAWLELWWEIDWRSTVRGGRFAWF